MFQFTGLPSQGLCVQPRDTRALPRVGFPIRRSRDQRLVSTSPGLIAAAHVLLRLLAPRHPPCALSLLIVKNTTSILLWSFQGARGRDARPTRGRRQRRVPEEQAAGLSKLNSEQNVRGRRDLGELDIAGRPIAEARGHRTGRAATGVRAPGSLERR